MLLSILTVAGALLCASVHAAFRPVWPRPPPCTDPPLCPYFPSFQGFLTDQGLPANGQLEETMSLKSPTSWTAVLITPVATSGKYNVTVPAGASARFYRLRKP